MKEHYDNLIDFLSDIAEAAKEEINKTSEDKYTKCENNCADKPKKVSDSNKPSYINPAQELKPMPGNISIEDDGNRFILNEMVNGWPTPYNQNLYFEHIDKDGYKYPGVTDSQILAVLYSRFKNDPKKLNLVRQLMSI